MEIQEREYIVLVQPIPNGRHIQVFKDINVAVEQITSQDATIHFVPDSVVCDYFLLTNYLAEQMVSGNYKAIKDFLH